MVRPCVAKGSSSGASSWHRQPLEKVLITQHQPFVIDHQVRFETGGQAQVDVTYSSGTLPVVPLLRTGDRQRWPINEGSVEREAFPRGRGHPTDGKSVAEGCDRQVWLLGAFKVRPGLAVHPPAGSGTLQAQHPTALGIPALNDD